MTNSKIIPQVSTTFTVGAILTDSWGYDQTNIDFYCIIKASGEWVTVLPMTKVTSAEIGFMTNHETPGEILVNETPIRKKLKKFNGEVSGFSFRNYTGGGWCRLWKGQPETSTHYA
jgi:hypothetical protein